MFKSLPLRQKAFSIHLIISVIIAAINLAVVFLIWHPSPLAKAIGVTNIFTMMVIIDAILGPLLTFVVAKEGKKPHLLKLDFTVIALVQIAALIYGLQSIAVNRPVYIAYDVIRFDLVQAGDIPDSTRVNAKTEYQKPNFGRPKYVSVIPAKTDQESNDRLFQDLYGGVAPSMQADLYEPLMNQWDEIQLSKRALSDLNEFNLQADVNRVLGEYPSATGWLALRAYEIPMVILLDDDRILDVVDLRPWTFKQP